MKYSPKNVTLKRVPLKRWEIAQKSEKDYWEKYDKESLFKRFEGAYSKKAKELLKEFKSLGSMNKDVKILQVGCAAFDCINYLKIGKRYALDPLADYYKEKFGIDYGKVKFDKGIGEDIPYKDGFFDVIILANVLDHVHSPEKVLDEVKRVLKKSGILYIDTHIATHSFIKIAKAYKIFQKIFMKKIFNIHHPYMFSLEEIRGILKERFTILKEDIGKDFLENLENLDDFKKSQKKQQKLSLKILANLGIYGEINYSAFCKKTD